MRKLRFPRWMYPGMHLKRWLLLSFLGITVMALGAAILIVDWYRGLPPDSVISLLTGAGLHGPSAPSWSPRSASCSPASACGASCAASSRRSWPVATR